MENRKKIKSRKISFFAGIGIVFGTHIYMLIVGGLKPEEMIVHPILNIIAGIMIMYGNKFKWQM